jgi:aspartate-semialdehyde dehydrogenase
MSGEMPRRWPPEFPVMTSYLASPRSAGMEVSSARNACSGRAPSSTSRHDIVLSFPGAKVSAEFAPRAAGAGAIVIDNTSCFRMDPEVPLVVPEVNPQAIAEYRRKNIIANPNCSTIQMVVALKPLHDLARIRRVVVATYQSVSGAGKDAMDELFNQTRGIYMNQPLEKEKFTKQIAFNCIPHIDVFMEDGQTKEEWKMAVETRKILDPKIKVSATCVRLPVFISHSEAINMEFERPISVEEAREALKAAPGISVVDHRANEGYVTPVEVAGEDNVYVSRIRETGPSRMASPWVVGDNLCKRRSPTPSDAAVGCRASAPAPGRLRGSSSSDSAFGGFSEAGAPSRQGRWQPAGEPSCGVAPGGGVWHRPSRPRSVSPNSPRVAIAPGGIGVDAHELGGNPLLRLAAPDHGSQACLGIVGSLNNPWPPAIDRFRSRPERPTSPATASAGRRFSKSPAAAWWSRIDPGGRGHLPSRGRSPWAVGVLGPAHPPMVAAHDGTPSAHWRGGAD